MRLENRAIVVAKLVAAGMLFGALARHGYDYYVLLRWVVCGVAAFAAFRASEAGRIGWTWALGIVALFFNPIIPVHLTRETWGFIHVGAALLLLVSIAFVDLRRVAGWLRTTGQLLRKTVKSLVRKVLSIWGLLLLAILRRVAGWLRTTGQLLRKTAKPLCGLLLPVAVLGGVLGGVLLLQRIIAPRPDNSNPMAEDVESIPDDDALLADIDALLAGTEGESTKPVPVHSAPPIRIRVKGWGVVNFPAGTPRDVMHKALRARFRPDLAEEAEQPEAEEAERANRQGR